MARQRKSQKATIPRSPWRMPQSRAVFLFAVMALVVLGPFNQGFYWPIDKLLFSLVCVGLALAWLIFGTPQMVSRWSWIHTTLAAVLGLYAVGLITPASVNGALRGLVLWAGLFALYWLVSALSFDEHDRKKLLGAVVTSGIAMAMIGLLVFSGALDAPQHLVGNRISAGFEYANATASWLMIAFLVSVAMGFREECRRWRVFWSASAVVVLPAFLLTLSRGGYLALLFGSAMLALVYWRRLLSLAAYAVLVTGAGVVFSLAVASYPGMPAVGGLLVAAGAIATLEARVLQKHSRLVGGMSFAILGIMVIGAFVVALGLVDAPGLLPDEVGTIFSRITLDGLLEDARFVFIGDGLRALRASPLLGYGGGAWNAVYPRYQTFHYGTLRAHADPLDIVLDVGILGLSAYLVFLVLALHQAWRYRHETGVAAILVLSGAVLFHSLGEALLAFPAVYACLIAVLGALPVRQKTSLSSKTLRTGLLISLLGVFLLVGGLVLAEIELGRLPRLAAAGQGDEVISALNRALSLNPWHADARRELDNQLATRTDERLAQRRNLELLVRYEPFDSRATNLLGHWYISQGDPSSAVPYHERSLSLQPRNVENFETLALTLSSAAINSKARSLPNTEAYLQRIFALYEQFNRTREIIPERWLAQSGIPFTMGPAMTLALGEALAVGERFDEAVPRLASVEAGGNSAFASRAGLMLARIYELLGKLAEAEALVSKHATSPALQAYIEYLRRVLR